MQIATANPSYPVVLSISRKNDAGIRPEQETTMLGTVLRAPGDIRCEEVAEPKIHKPADAIIKLSASAPVPTA